MTYSYTTPLGTFILKPEYGNPERYGIWVNGECYGSYGSARLAASDVYAHGTGYAAWDLAQHLHAPEDLSEWKKFTENR